MQWRPITLLLLITSIFLTAGCNGAFETDDVAYILSVGIDAAPNNQFTITYRLAVPVSLAGLDPSQSQAKKSSTLVTLTAPSLSEGRNLLKSIISREPKISQTKIIVVSEDIARNGLDALLGSLTRYREYRGTIFLAVVRGSVREVFEKNAPDIDSLTSRWVETIFQSSNESSYYLPADVHQFYKRLKNESGAPYTALMGLNPLVGENLTNSEPDKDKGKELLATQMPRQSGNRLEILGTAVFKGDKLVGFLTNKETRAMSILLGNFNRGFMTIEDPLEPTKAVNINIHLDTKPKINVDISRDIPIITISISLDGELIGIPTGINYEAPAFKTVLENQVSNTIAEQITSMLSSTQQLGTDVVNFGYYIRPQFTTLQELENYHWDSKYPQTIFKLEVHTKLRQSGLMRKTMPIRKD
ncbi:MAG: germination protein, Ger(x)C family [Firmicutes bacterium]|nr:germination protein, Ger(x)C family [Bacillota bacterium]